MSGMMMGMNFINKGIDQFSYGVGQEYKRHERHRLRDYAVEDRDKAYAFQRGDFEHKMDMAKKFGIHPLAMLGSDSSYPIASMPSTPSGTMPPSGGGNPILSQKRSREEKRILTAQARKAEAEATIMEREANNNGQGNAGTVPGTGAAPAGQTDGQYSSMESNVTFAENYTVDSEGNAYIKPTQSNEQAFGEEGTIMNRALYNARKIYYPEKIRQLKNNWSNPKYSGLKKQFLMTRPHDPQGKWIFLWDQFGWKRVTKTKENTGHIFLNTRHINPGRTKRVPHKSKRHRSYQNYADQLRR